MRFEKRTDRLSQSNIEPGKPNIQLQIMQRLWLDIIGLYIN